MKALIKTEAELKAFTGVSVALSVETLESHLTYSIPENEIVKILSQELYEELLEAYDTDALDDEGNEHLKALLPYAQKPLANLAVYHYMQEGSVMVSDEGTTTNREKAAYQWQQIKAEDHYLRLAYFGLDKLITFLITNKANYTGWDESSAYTNVTEFFINTPQEFQNYINIKESYRTLVALHPVMRNVEATYILPQIGDTLFEDASIKNDASILKYIRPAVAFLTMAEAIDELSIELTADGAYVYSLKSQTDNIQEKNAPTETKIGRYQATMRTRGLGWLEKLRAYLNANASASKYAAYYNSDLYEDPADVAQTYEQDTNSNVYNAL